MVMEKSGLECAMDIAAHGFAGIGFSILKEWAEKLIEERHLVMECGRGDMSGEAHALFQHNGETLRLKRDWMGHYQLFHGDWEPDPHWRGD